MDQSVSDSYQDYIARKRMSERSDAPERRSISVEQYGYHAGGQKVHRPRVRGEGKRYTITPAPYHQGLMSDDLMNIVIDRMPMWLQILVFFVPFLPVYKKYAREFWIENGFDPDAFTHIL